MFIWVKALKLAEIISQAVADTIWLWDFGEMWGTWVASTRAALVGEEPWGGYLGRHQRSLLALTPCWAPEQLPSASGSRWGWAAGAAECSHGLCVVHGTCTFFSSKSTPVPCWLMQVQPLQCSISTVFFPSWSSLCQQVKYRLPEPCILNWKLVP